jgi:predicted small lipoprotein YifL
VLALALVATGCGQKGPLMLPAAKAPAATADGASVPASSASAPARNP